ncbi:MAG TPA: DUF4880 domain-containing protein [Sphingomonadaceae bacterium]|nr:DUF4880 domain-containing protein [Sphingomonadaceae bacterium]
MSLFRRALQPGEFSAVDWIVRLNSENRTEADEQAFHAWLSADPENLAEFERLTEIWNIVPGSWPQTDLAMGDAAPPAPLLTRRRAMMLGGGAAAAVLTGGLAVQPAMATTVFETKIGESRRLHLSDGSDLLLDADSRIRFRDSWLGRDLWLEKGRISLHIARSRIPFQIDVGADEFTAREGQFDVSRLPPHRSEIVALKGEASARIAGSERIVGPGERLRNTTPGDIIVDQPAEAVVGAWKAGRIVIENGTLRDFVDEANRYGRIRLLLASDAVAGLRISGIYRLGDNRALAGTLGEMFDLPVVENGGAITLGIARP